MGCDIHGWIEKRVDGKWAAHREISGYGGPRVGEDGGRSETSARLPVKDRDYRFFGKIAGVRGVGHRRPLGLPDDVSVEAKEDSDFDGADGHSHSWLILEEAGEAWWEASLEWAADVRSEWDAKFPCAEPFGIPVPDGEYRFVFWFDN